MNDFTKELFKGALRVALWVTGGMMIGHSFSQINSFSAETLFSLGAIAVITGFYV